MARRKAGRSAGRVLGVFSNKESDQVWDSLQLFVGNFPEGVVAIGGVAVFLHCFAARRIDLATEFTHDADIMVDIAALGAIRDACEVTPNPRLSKFQIELNSVEFDIYRQGSHGLRVDYPDLAMHSSVVEGVRIAHKQHLLLLKLAALLDRKSSAHGQKDARDIAKLLILSSADAPFVQGYLTKEDVKLLDGVMQGPALHSVAGENIHITSKLRGEASKFVNRLKKAAGYSTAR